MTGSIEDLDDLLAAELALGLLEGEERAAAERRLARDLAFAAAHETWALRFSRLTPPVVAPAGVWPAIVTRLPANDPGADPRALGRWRLAALAASAAALLLAILPAIRPALPPPPPARAPAVVVAPELVAVLTAATGEGAMAVTIDPASGRMTTAPAHVTANGRATELWLIHGKDAPRSLGVVAHDAPGHGIAAALIRDRMAVGDTLAISLEPAGGSRTGAPTGPVILTGKIARV